jgi:Flp pilus assembly protein TadD
MPRPRVGGRPALVAAALTVGIVFGLSACGGSNGQALASQACLHVKRSVTDYTQSTQTGLASATAGHLRDRADAELRAALSLASQANSDDGSWNSLMTTIGESATVDEGHLIPSLKAQCAVADTNPNVNPQSPGGNVNPKTPTANVNPQSP